jgi:hypothetical protein
MGIFYSQFIIELNLENGCLKAFPPKQLVCNEAALPPGNSSVLALG